MLKASVDVALDTGTAKLSSLERITVDTTVQPKLKVLRQDAWRLMHAPLVEQHRWYVRVLRGHYGYFGVPHNWRALNAFMQEVRRIWFTCLRRRSQKNRDQSWTWFEQVTARFPLSKPRITHPWTPGAA